MRLRILILILLSIIILNHCNNNPTHESQNFCERVTIDENKKANVQFRLIDAVQTDFIAYARIAVSPRQDMIILYGISTQKNEKQKLIARTFDKSLKFIREKTFFFGKGPSDVGNFNIISIGKDYIYISENSNSRISIYTNDWIYKNSIKFKSAMDAFEIYSNEKVFLNCDYTAFEDNLFAYTFLLGSFPELKTKVLFTADPFLLQVESGNHTKLVIGTGEYSFFYTNNEAFILICDNYRLLKFDNTGNKLNDIIINVKKIKTNHARDDEYLKEFGYSQQKDRFVLSDTVNPAATMIPLKKGFVVIRRYDFYSSYQDWLDGDYFSYKLEYQGKISVPFSPYLIMYMMGRTHEFTKFDNGFLYLIKEKEDEDDMLTLEKWMVIE